MRSRPRSPAYATQLEQQTSRPHNRHRSATHTFEPRFCGQGYLIQGGVAPHEWVHCCLPGAVQAPPAIQAAQVNAHMAAVSEFRHRLFKSRLCKNWLQWGTPSARPGLKPDKLTLNSELRASLHLTIYLSIYPIYLSIRTAALPPAHAPAFSTPRVLYACYTCSGSPSTTLLPLEPLQELAATLRTATSPTVCRPLTLYTRSHQIHRGERRESLTLWGNHPPLRHLPSRPDLAPTLPRMHRRVRAPPL